MFLITFTFAGIYSIFFLSFLVDSRPPKGVDVKENQMGGVSWHASSAGQLMAGAARLGQVSSLCGGYTELQE